MVFNQRDEFLNNRLPNNIEHNHIQHPEQEYFCANIKTCGTKIMSRGIPGGWYLIRKSHGNLEPLKTAAIVCSLTCGAMNMVEAMGKRLKDTY